MESGWYSPRLALTVTLDILGLCLVSFVEFDIHLLSRLPLDPDVCDENDLDACNPWFVNIQWKYSHFWSSHQSQRPRQHLTVLQILEADLSPCLMGVEGCVDSRLCCPALDRSQVPRVMWSQIL